MKKCTKCSQDEASKGSSWCKKCLSDYKKEHYKKNKDKYLEKAKQQRTDNPKEVREYQKEYYQKNKEVLLEKGKQYSSTKKGKAARQRASTNYRKSDQYNLKQNARKKVLRAVQSGKLVKPNLCEVCRKEKFVEAHHEDYNKPLEVKWLCKECHENTHHLNEGHESM